MNIRRIFIALALVISAAAQPAFGSVSPWSNPFSEDGAFNSAAPQTVEESLQYPTASTIAVMPDGTIVYWNGLQDLENSNYPLSFDAGKTGGQSKSRVLDLRASAQGLGSPIWSTPTPENGGKDDMFCADQRLLSDGRLIAIGGTDYRSDPVDLTQTPANDVFGALGQPTPGGTAELFGSPATRTYQNGTWTVQDDMAYGRWYPTALTMSDGKIFVAGGTPRVIYNSTNSNVIQTETFNPANDSWTTNPATADVSLPLFPRLHLSPTGKIFYDGSGQMWSPAGQSTDEATWNFHKSYDPATQTWTQTGIGAYGARSSSFSVSLPLEPDALGNYGRDFRVLIGGGTVGVTPSTFLANNFTEIVTVSEDAYGTVTSSSDTAAPLTNNRWYSSGVVLPNGNVMAFSGADKDEVIAPGTETPVHTPEVWDGDTWTPLADASRDRTYHNSAILLPDGSVLTGGHAPINQLYGPKGNGDFDEQNGGLTANNLKDPSFEIFYPDYFNSPRPALSYAPKAIKYGQDFNVALDSVGDIDHFMLMRLPSATHVTDADQRAIKLNADELFGGFQEVSDVPSSNIAPPGYYYLFAVDEDGTPSRAAIVEVGDTTDIAPAPMPFGNAG